MDDATLATRFTAIEQQLKVVSDHLGIPCPPFFGVAVDVAKPGAVSGPDPLTAELTALAHAGKKIQAIKLLRERTGMGLAEAKGVVDRL